MGNPQHLEWLLEGVESWNERREEEPFKPDLSDVDVRQAFINKRIIEPNEFIPLARANFEKANLWGANLRRADLRRADLRRADLGETDLGEAILENAKLRRAGLGKANLWKADLRGADFGEAVLENAKLTGADLRRANLWMANLRGAKFAGAVLSGAELKGSTATTIVNSGEATNSEGPPGFTNLSETLGLTQIALELMDGDTGTILPEDLTRPDNWPDWRDQLEGANDTVETEREIPAKVPITKSTPPADFETREDQIDLWLSPLNPMPRRASRTPIDEALRDQKVQGIMIVAEQLVDQLNSYEDEDSNRATVATQLQKTSKRIANLTAAGGERLIIHAFYQLVEAIGRAYAEDALSLEANDRELYKSLVDAGRDVYPMYPGLADQLEPANDQLVPDDTKVRSEQLIAALENVLYGENTKQFFDDKTREVFEAELEALTPVGRDEEKNKILRFGGLLGELHNEMEQNRKSEKIRNHTEWLAASAIIMEAWLLVAPFLGV